MRCSGAAVLALACAPALREPPPIAAAPADAACAGRRAIALGQARERTSTAKDALGRMVARR